MDQIIQVKRMLNLPKPIDKRAVTVRKLKECIEHNAGGIWAGSVKVKLLQDALELIDK